LARSATNAAATACADYPAVNNHAHLQMLYRVIYFMHSKRTSVTWLLSYFAVPCCASPASSEVSEKWEHVPCTDCTGQSNDFELIPTVQIETRHHVDGSFGSEFPSICNRPKVARWQKFREIFAFFEITTPYGKIFQILFRKFRKFLSPHRSTCCVQILWARNRRNCTLITWQKKKQNFAWLSSCRYCSDRAQNLPRPATDNVLRVL